MLVASVQAPPHPASCDYHWHFLALGAEGLVCMPYLCQWETSMSPRPHWCRGCYQETHHHTGVAADNGA